MSFFTLSSGLLALVLMALIVGAAGLGFLLGRARGEGASESSGVLQGALLGFMALVLAFGLTLAVGRYESRRGEVVNDANVIGTAYLRAQTLPEPIRSKSLALILSYTDVQLDLSDVVPGTPAADRAVSEGSALQRRLWSLAGQAVEEQPAATAPRLYVESLNAMIDEQTVRVAGLSNRVPTTVLVLQVLGASLAMSLLGLHVGVLGRGVLGLILAATMVASLLYVSFDLDRPTRGLIEVPNTPIAQLRDSMNDPPAYEKSP